jgi:hypothetical protein
VQKWWEEETFHYQAKAEEWRQINIQRIALQEVGGAVRYKTLLYISRQDKQQNQQQQQQQADTIVRTKTSSMMITTISTTKWTFDWDQLMIGFPWIWTLNRSNVTTSWFRLTRRRICFRRTVAILTVATKVGAKVLIRGLLMTKMKAMSWTG